MFIMMSLVIVILMGLALIRAYLGPTKHDRVLATNSFGNKTVLLIAVSGFLTERPDFLDIALVYAMINFISTIAILKFFQYSTMKTDLHNR